MITWEPLLERHVRGTCNRGVVWIRLNREDKETGIYTLFAVTDKLVPRTERDETLAGAKEWAEDNVQLMDWAEELELINNKKKKR